MILAMAKHIQRKRFDHPQLAAEAAQGFTTIDPSVPGAKVTARAVEQNGEYWVYVTSEGDLVTADAMVLPGYEVVA